MVEQTRFENMGVSQFGQSSPQCRAKKIEKYNLKYQKRHHLKVSVKFTIIITPPPPENEATKIPLKMESVGFDIISPKRNRFHPVETCGWLPNLGFQVRSMTVGTTKTHDRWVFWYEF